MPRSYSYRPVRTIDGNDNDIEMIGERDYKDKTYNKVSFNSKGGESAVRSRNNITH